MMAADPTQANPANAIALLAALLAFVGGLTGSALATFGTLYTARLRRFASERWWERKASAYVETVDLLAKLRNRVAMMTEDLAYGQRINRAPPSGVAQAAERLNEVAYLAGRSGRLAEDVTKLEADLEDATPRGTLLLSATASGAVANCTKTVLGVLRFSEGGSDEEHNEAGRRMVAAIDEAIAVVNREAKRDLSVREGWWRLGKD